MNELPGRQSFDTTIRNISPARQRVLARGAGCGFDIDPVDANGWRPEEAQ